MENYALILLYIQNKKQPYLNIDNFQ